MGKLRDFKHKFEYDPKFQTTLHIRMSYFWLFNAAVVIGVFFFAKGIWAQSSIFYLTMVSLYANFATDYGAVSASEASEHTDDPTSS